MSPGKAILFLTLLLCALDAHSQVDSLSLGQKLLKENQTAKARKFLKGFTLGSKQRAVTKKDSITKPAADSLRLRFQQASSPVTKLKANIRSGIDSTVRAVNSPVTKANSKLTSVQQRINNKADSLANKINEPITNVGKSITHTYDSITGKANEAIKSITDPLGIDAGKIPGLPNETNAIPQLQAKDLNVSTTSLTRELSAPSMKDIPGMDNVAKVKDLKNMPQEKLTTIQNTEKIQSATNKIQALDGKLERVEKLEDDAKNVAQGNLKEVKQAPEELEKQLVARSGIKETEKYMSKMEQQRAMLEKYKDRKLVEQELRNKTLNVATEKVNHDLPQIDNADKKLKKTRKKFSSFQSIKDLPKRPVNEMKGKPFAQRFLPSTTLHFFSYDGNKIFDVAAQGAYKLDSRFVVGLGGIYRIAISKSYKYFISDFGLYGGRTFGEVRLIKGFIAHADLEYLYLNKQYYPAVENASPRVAQSNFGIGKSFAITKRIRGTATGLYRVEYSGTLQGQPKFTMRVGFELSPKKKRYQDK